MANNDKLTPELMDLIETLPIDKIEKIIDLMEQDKPRHYTQYKVLQIALDAELLNDEQVERYYGMNINKLNETDKLIASVIIDLTIKTQQNVKVLYEEAFSLDPTQPELLLLLELIYNIK